MPRSVIHRSLGLAAAVAVLAAGSAIAARPQPPAKPGAGAPSIAIPLRATLSASQVPSLSVASTATGRFLGALIRSGFGAKGERPNLSWGLFWALGVTNTTGPVTGVEIRSGDVSVASSSLFLKLCGPCTATSAASVGAPGTTLLSGKLPNLTSEQVATLRQGNLYVNVTTAANPSGELRGPITRSKPITSHAPPNTKMPNPLKPVPSGSKPAPPIKIPGP
jgi:hypothetical protein